MRDGHATTADDLADATAAAVAAVDAVTAVEDLRAVLDLDRVDGVTPPRRRQHACESLSRRFHDISRRLVGRRPAGPRE